MKRAIVTAVHGNAESLGRLARLVTSCLRLVEAELGASAGQPGIGKVLGHVQRLRPVVELIGLIAADEGGDDGRDD